MVFLDYITVDVPANNSNGSIVYTTTYRCIVFFEPIGARMEDDDPIGLYVDNYLTDSDGGQADLYLYYSRAVTSTALQLNGNTVAQASGSSHIHFTSSITPAMIQSGKNIRTFIGDSSDKIGGTLHIFRLPEQVW